MFTTLGIGLRVSPFTTLKPVGRGFERRRSGSAGNFSKESRVLLGTIPGNHPILAGGHESLNGSVREMGVQDKFPRQTWTLVLGTINRDTSDPFRVTQGPFVREGGSYFVFDLVLVHPRPRKTEEGTSDHVGTRGKPLTLGGWFMVTKWKVYLFHRGNVRPTLPEPASSGRNVSDDTFSITVLRMSWGPSSDVVGLVGPHSPSGTRKKEGRVRR